jgi:DNA polymerase-3 subunit gamma/tau
LLAFPPQGNTPLVRSSAPLQVPMVARAAVPVPPKAVPLPMARPAAAAAGPAVRPTASPSPPAARPASTPRPLRAAQDPPPWLDEPPPEDESATGGAALLSPPALAEGPTRVTSAPAAAPRAALLRTELGDRWAEVAAPLLGPGGLSALVRELAWQAELVAVQGNAWQLRVERESLRAGPLRDKLQAALAAAGHAVQLELLPGAPQDSLALRDGEARERAQAAAEATIRSDAVVMQLLAQFPTARIVPGSIKPVEPA